MDVDVDEAREHVRPRQSGFYMSGGRLTVMVADLSDEAILKKDPTITDDVFTR